MSDHYWYNNNSPIHGFWLLPGDDLTTTADNSFEVFRTLQPGTGGISGYWGTAYQMIARANVVLQKVQDDEISSVIVTPGLKESIEGEALFLRAYMYMQLWNFFGTAPLITERVQSSEGITQPSTEGTALLDQAITDFGLAAGLLPASWPTTNRGRVTKNSANGMLGKALVIRASWNGSDADYSSAISAFTNISGVSLVADFSDNHNVATENNDESLFEYQAGQGSSDNVWLSNDFGSIGSFSSWYGYFNGHWATWGSPMWTASTKLVDLYEVGDPRIDHTYDVGNRQIRKYVTNDALTGSGVASYNNPRILRYADVLLLWAEALNETGSSGPAVDMINEVRKRARDMAATGAPADRGAGSQAEVRTWIQDERLMELACEEGHRWIDLRRWHKAGHINLSTWDFSSDKTNFAIELPKHLLYPIPNSETDLNPNVTQNPGY